MHYRILIYLLYSCLLDFIQSNRDVYLDLLKTIIHGINKPILFSFASFLQIYSDIYYAENTEFNTFYYNYAVRKT